MARLVTNSRFGSALSNQGQLSKEFNVFTSQFSTQGLVDRVWSHRLYDRPHSATTTRSSISGFSWRPPVQLQRVVARPSAGYGGRV